MQSNASYGMGPSRTPHPLKIFLVILAASSLIAPFFPILQTWLALSLPGIQHLFLWQLLSYSFVEINPLGISFPFFMQLAFNLYLLWVLGAMLMERSKPLFFALYFGAAVVAGLFAIGIMYLTHSHQLISGAIIPLYGVMVAWTMVYPETTLLLFLTMPVRATWLILGIIGINLFIDLANTNWVGFVTTASSSLFGYLFSLIAWKRRSVFSFLHPFENWLLRLTDTTPVRSKEPKIYDIQSGKPRLNDDQFMDAMLEKISRLGQESLTPQEKERMQQISKRKSL
jgi:hypothetical protein